MRLGKGAAKAPRLRQTSWRGAEGEAEVEGMDEVGFGGPVGVSGVGRDLVEVPVLDSVNPTSTHEGFRRTNAAGKCEPTTCLGGMRLIDRY